MTWTIRKKGEVYLIEQDRKGMKVINPKDAEWVYQCLIYGASHKNEVLASFSTKENNEKPSEKFAYEILNDLQNKDANGLNKEDVHKELNKLMGDIL